MYKLVHKRIKIYGKYLLVLWTFPVLALQGQSTNSAIEVDIRDTYFQLLDAIGYDNRPLAPKLLFSDIQSDIATYNPRTNEITLKYAFCQDVYQHLGSRARDGILFILAHELGHFTHKSTCEDKFSAVRSSINKIELDKNEEELKADIYGLFASYIANPKALDTYREFLELVYTEVPIQSIQYQQRMALVDSLEQKVEKLIMVFEVASLLTITENHLEAERAYQHILDEYGSREIYNNMAVNLLQESLKYVDEFQSRFAYPFELDAKIRLYEDERKPTPNLKQKERLISAAIEHLDTALEQDAAYPSTYINLVSAHLLMGNLKGAKKIWAKIPITGIPERKSELRDIKDLLLAFIKVQEKKPQTVAEARQILIRLIKSSHTSVQNMAELTFKAIPGRPLTEEPPCRGSFYEEYLDEIDLYEVQINRTFSKANLGSTNRISIFTKTLPQSVLIAFEPNIFFQIPKDTSVKTIRGIGIGTPLSTVFSTYNCPYLITNTKSGAFYYFKESQIIFLVDKQDRVQNWYLYYRQKM